MFSVLDTTYWLFVSSLVSLLSTWLGSLLPSPSPAPLSTPLIDPSSSLSYLIPPALKDPTPRTISWTSSPFTLSNGLGHRDPILMDEQLFLSLAFATSMRPSDVRPYFYRAQGGWEREEITVTTLITSNRFRVFGRLVEKYRGPISVTVHIRDVEEHVQEVLTSLHEMYTSSALMQTYVDVHLVVDSFDRQFNTWRNIARLFARTDYVMMLDIDFYPCTDFKGVVRALGGGDGNNGKGKGKSGMSKGLKEKLEKGRAGLVIPAFEYGDFAEGTDYANFPSTKAGLLALVKEERIGMFHAGPGHNSTDYKKFYSAAPGEVYKVTRYQPSYEPYVIFRKDGPPWCDARFVGYGGNKAACLFEMYLSGMSYYVLADHFIIHQNHLYEEIARKTERRFNKKIHLDFREETCLKYLKKYHDSGILGTEVAENALTECKKLKTVPPLTRSVPKINSRD
ncbi:hypothetical protein CVT26_008020 [Gymnopilus dilepis]|uniref:Glycosyltransferase family 49 protein n=1 Tax=Gymnopilus dilepis TaxID=231916 RepID=A0A409YJH6_9AGAR|nr:hypothetical protein CVT26_008020 [Gymnopilus dilepis]